MNSTFLFLSIWFRGGAATGFADCAARWNSQQRSKDGASEVKPEVLQVSTDDGGGDRSGRIHGSPANRSGEHCFKANDSADSDSRGDALFVRFCRDVQNWEHYKEIQS